MRAEVLIVGAGIGGLAAAVALRRARCEVQVFERDAGISSAGAGLMLQANALAALEKIGVAEEVARAGVTIGSSSLSTRTGAGLLELDFSGASVLGVGIHRAALHRILAAHAGREQVRTGAPVVGYRLAADRVVVELASGEEVAGDLLVGADGVHSTVRARHLADGAPRYAGYTCWRGVTPQGDRFRRGQLFEIWGAGQRFGGLHIDERLYWFAPVNAPPDNRDEPGRARPELLELYRDWPEPVLATIASTSESEIVRNDVIDRPFRRDWGRGRMTLLGDAAHPMTPDLAQGACQAIEDAVVLGRCVGQTDDPIGALRRYERARVARTRSVVRRSRTFGRLAQLENPLARRLRDGLVRATPGVLVRRELRRTLQFSG